jgi:hypothetical protein
MTLNTVTMKWFFILLFNVPLFIYAQECKLSREVDPYTKEVKVSTGFIKLEDGSVTIDADGKEIDMLFSIEGIDKCFDNNSSAAIFFENSKIKMSLRNAGTMNCEGLFHFIFKNANLTNPQLKKIITQKITHIIFTGNNKKTTTVTFPAEQQPVFMALGNCLVEDAKKLIK